MIHFDHESAGISMRGRFRDQGGLFSYISPEARVPPRHPLRQIRALVRTVLKDLSHSFGKLYSSEGRPSIPPEQLLSALLLQAFYGIRSERQLMEQLNYNLLYRWFVGLAPDDPVWDATTFTKNRDRLQQGDVFQKFMTKLLNHPQVKPLLSDEHFSVDGTLIEAWASQKSFRARDGGDTEGDGADFHGQTRSNETHASTTDPESRLYRKAAGREARLCFMGHVTMENRHGLAVAGAVTNADGMAESPRRASHAESQTQSRRSSHHGRSRQGLRHEGSCRTSARLRRHAACRAKQWPDQNRAAAKKRDRWPHDTPCELWRVAKAPQDDRMHLRLGQAAWHDAQGQTPRHRPCRRRISAEPHRLQPDPHPEIGRRVEPTPGRH
jgi:transposase